MARYFITLLLLISTLAVEAGTQKSQGIQAEISDIRKNIEKTDQDLQKQKKEASHRKENLASIEKKIADSENEMSKLNGSLGGLKKDLLRLEKERDDLMAKHSRSLSLLEKQLNQHLKTYQAEQLPFVFQVDHLSSFPRLAKLYEILHQERETELNQISTNLQSVIEAQKKVEDKTSTIQRTLQKIGVIKTTLSEQKATQVALVSSLQSSIENTSQQLSKLKKDEAALTKVLNKLEKEAKAANRLAQKQSPPTPNNTPIGKWGYPVSKSLFSLEKATFFPQSRYPNFIPLKANTPIQSIAGGKVVFSDWLRGLGLLLIVDHGNGTLSLYGNNERLLKKTGETVSTGEVVAYSGQTGGIPQAGLYFEIRQQGRLLNPESWFKF